MKMSVSLGCVRTDGTIDACEVCKGYAFEKYAQTRKNVGFCTMKAPCPDSTGSYSDVVFTPFVVSRCLRNYHDVQLLRSQFCRYFSSMRLFQPVAFEKEVPVADDIDGAAHVDVHEIHRNLLIQQLAAPRERIREPATDLGAAASQSAQNSTKHGLKPI